MSTSFTIGTDGGISAYRKMPKNPNENITAISATGTSNGILYTQLYKAATNVSAGPVNTQSLTADNATTYRMIGDNMGFISFNYVLSESADASLSIVFTDQGISDAITLYDSMGRGLLSTNGALHVAIGDTAINVDISLEDNIVINGKTSGNAPVAIAVNESGQLLTINTPQSISSVQSVYASATNLNADSATSTMDIGTTNRQINIRGQSSQLCTLKVQTSPTSDTFYDSIYNCIIKTANTNFNISVPTADRYIRLVPDIDTSLILSYTY